MSQSFMVQTVFLFILGLIIICYGGDKFVDNAVIVAKKLGMSEIMVGATIVSIGTTLPEVLVSTTAAFDGSAAICAGNAYGSIICNTALIAGISQFCRPSKGIDKKSFNWNVGLFFFFSALLFVIQYLTGSISRLTGFILLAGFLIYTIGYIRIARGGANGTAASGANGAAGAAASGANGAAGTVASGANGAAGTAASDANGAAGAEKEQASERSLPAAFLLMAVFAAALFIGARLLVDNGIILAEAFGVPERVIAVTFIALGTSLPELVTTITSLVKGYASLGLGNILGANLLNLLLVIGIPSAISPFAVERQTTFIDVPMSVGVMLVLTVPFFLKKRGYRLQGLALLLIYAGYCVYSFL